MNIECKTFVHNVYQMHKLINKMDFSKHTQSAHRIWNFLNHEKCCVRQTSQASLRPKVCRGQALTWNLTCELGKPFKPIIKPDIY